VTGRLRLRPAAPADVDALHALWTDPAVRRWLWDDVPIDREVAAAVLTASVASFAAHGWGCWVLEPRDGDAVVGFAALRPVGEGPDVELLYGLDPAYWGRGFATEAAAAVLHHAFAAGLDRVVGRVDEPNRASIAVLERLGMTRVGVEAGVLGPVVRYARDRPPAAER
jgi:RimJ/RimL family protein N-acetyltransferase